MRGSRFSICHLALHFCVPQAQGFVCFSTVKSAARPRDGFWFVWSRLGGVIIVLLLSLMLPPGIWGWWSMHLKGLPPPVTQFVLCVRHF